MDIRVSTKVLLENVKERDHFGDQGIDGEY
jgi:hypothetical protein